MLLSDQTHTPKKKRATLHGTCKLHYSTPFKVESDTSSSGTGRFPANLVSRPTGCGRPVMLRTHFRASCALSRCIRTRCQCSLECHVASVRHSWKCRRVESRPAGAHARCRSVDVARDLHGKAGRAAAQSSGVAPYGGRSHGASPARASVCASIKVTQTIDRILMAALKYGYLQLFGLNPRFSHGPDSSPTIGELSCFLSIYLRPVSVPGNSRSESVRCADSAGPAKRCPKNHQPRCVALRSRQQSCSCTNFARDLG